MRRLPTARRFAAIAVLVVAALGVAFGALSGPAGAQTDPPNDDGSGGSAGFVNVIEVSGYLDPILVEWVEDGIVESEATDAQTLVLQLNSGGSVVTEQRLDELRTAIETAAVPVAIWVGPSSASAKAEAAELLELVPTELRGIASGATVQVRDTDSNRTVTLSADEAAEQGLIENPTPTLGDFLVDLPGFETRVEESDDGEPRRVPETVTRFAKLPLFRQLLHTVASPAVTYLLLAIGMGLILFEFYTAGIGIAGVIGAVCVVLAGYGLGVLPTTGYGLALLGLGMFGFAVDIQAGVPRFWTGVGVASWVAGSILLFDGVSLGWIPLIVGVGGMMLAMISGMPAMVRTRFSTPTLGREWMIGEVGVADESVDPEGTVRIRDALWRARTNRATPIPSGDEVKVAGIEGLILEVEPLEGAARDYREKRSRK